MGLLLVFCPQEIFYYEWSYTQHPVLEFLWNIFQEWYYCFIRYENAEHHKVMLKSIHTTSNCSSSAAFTTMLGTVKLLNYYQLDGCKMISFCGPKLYFLLHPFFFSEISVHLLCPILYWIVHLFLNYLCVLDTNPLSVICFANILLQITACLHFFMLSLFTKSS